MSDFATYWQRIVGTNPKLSDETGYIKMTVAEFQRQLELAWRAAQRLTPERDVFDLLFGGRKPCP